MLERVLVWAVILVAPACEKERPEERSPDHMVRHGEASQTHLSTTNGDARRAATASKTAEVLLNLTNRGDTSCLRDGKTRVSAGLSSLEVQEILEFTVKHDDLTVWLIELRPTSDDPRRIFVATGVGCVKGRNVGGHGSFLTISKKSGSWTVLRHSHWAS